MSLGLADGLDVRARRGGKKELRMTWVDDEQWERKRFVENQEFCFAILSCPWNTEEPMRSRRASLEFRGEVWAGARHLGVVTLS